jgi:hypothetical protein
LLILPLSFGDSNQLEALGKRADRDDSGRDLT